MAHQNMGAHRLIAATRCHTGLVRRHNQDQVAFDLDHGATVLADGMGGHRAGDVASRVATERALAELVVAQRESVADTMAGLLRIGQAVEAANEAILDTCAAQPELHGMGTTLVVAAFRDRRVFYAHVGDSRLYRVRFGRIRRLTRDHSLIQRVVDDGVFLNRDAAREAGIRDNVLTRSLGLQRQAEVDVGNSALEPGDTYLICSDGLHGAVTDVEIARLLRDPDGDLESQAEALLDAALAAGGSDNISLILARPLVD
jgi:protein phosphatase